MSLCDWNERLKYIHLGIDRGGMHPSEADIVTADIVEIELGLQSKTRPSLKSDSSLTETCVSERYPVLHRPVLEFYKPSLVVLPPTLSIHDALAQLYLEDADFALIQESADTILGVLDRSAIEALVESSNSVTDDLVVASVMSRNVCIEPDSASLSEVMERITLGSCPCTVIVDRLGKPSLIVSPQSLVELLEADDASPRMTPVYSMAAAAR